MESPPRYATSSIIDPDLMARVVKGDRQAFEQLYDLSSPLLFPLALRILRNRDEAAELLQDVYLEVWRKSVRYDIQRGTPLAWLTILTRSRAIDRLRSRGARGCGATDPINQTPASVLSNQDTSPFTRQAEAELRALVSKALSELPAPQQQALELAFYEGLSHTEIAKRLNEPLGTIKTQLKEGMGKLKSALRPVL